MKKVLFLARLFAPHKGGVETHVLSLARVLVKKGYEVTILTEQFEKDLPLEQSLHSMKVVRIPNGLGSDKIKLWRWVWQHSQLFVEADIIHVHDVFWWIIPILPFIRSKYFITFHGWEGAFPIKKTVIVQRQLAARLARGVIHIGMYIQTWYGTKADLTLYGGIDAEKLKVKDEKVSYEFAFIGRLDQDNDMKKVLAFFELIKKEKPAAKFIFIGDGPLKKECLKVGEVTGFVEDPERYLAQAKYVCASSYLAILESLALDKTVFSFYSNPLKKEYLTCHPQAKSLVISDDPKAVFSIWQQSPKPSATVWARAQTWQRVAEQYQKLWENKL